VDARKEPITSERVWAILGEADKVYVASGRNTLGYEPDDNNRDELVKLATGRTGNLRAPTLKIGNELYIGFNASMYEDVFK